MGKRGFRITLGVVVAALVATGVLLGLSLSGSNPPHPATAARGSGGSGSGSSGDRSTTSGGSGGGGSSGSADPGSSGGQGGGASAGTTSSVSGTTTTTGPVKVPAICTVVSRSKGTVVLRSCSQLASTGGSGTFPVSLLARSGSGTVTWNGTGTSTFVYTISHPASQRRKCPYDGTETTVKGSVTSNNLKGAGNVGLRGPVHAKLCSDRFGRIELLPGRAFQF